MLLRYRGVQYNGLRSQWASGRSAIDQNLWITKQSCLFSSYPASGIPYLLCYRGNFYIQELGSNCMVSCQPTERQPMGRLNNWLYRLGWQYQQHQHFLPLQHGLFRIFVYYRQGSADAAQWSLKQPVE